jgi:peptide/nickel transport system substrate-binding protein
VKKISFLFILLLLLISGCGNGKKTGDKSVIIGISSDIQSATPIYMFGVSESLIFEETNLGLVGHKWNNEKGLMTDYPLLADNWQWNEDLTEVVFELREDVTWDDNIPFNAGDVVFTYKVYSDPEVESVFDGWFEKFYRHEDGSINIEKTFEIISPAKIKFKFPPDSHPSLLETDVPLIAKHIFENIPFNQIKSHEAIFKNCGTGPYKLKKWERNQYIILEKRPDQFLAKKSSPGEIIFKIIPDYFSRKNQLISGEIDILNEINTEDVEELLQNHDMKVSSMKGRDYDFICWNNIDPAEFEKGKIADHKIFGNSNVRKALTYAINRQSIVDEFLMGYGEIANGPISRIFRDYYISPENEFKYSPQTASEILKNEGWLDSDNDGILDKNGVDFSFSLNYASGKPIREYTANIVKANLRQIGIDV